MAKVKKETTTAKAKKETATAEPKVDLGTIELTRLQDAVLEIPIKGLTPLIMHNWSEKAKRMMPGHPEGEGVKKVRGKKNPKEEAEAALYKLGKDLGYPSKGFKAAMIAACRFFDKPSMAEAKTLLTMDTEFTRIQGKKELHEDLVRLPKGGAELRYRYYIMDWSAVLRICYVAERISRESVIALADAGGRCGVGDWRPSSPKSMTGTYGTWRVDHKATVRDITV